MRYFFRFAPISTKPTSPLQPNDNASENKATKKPREVFYSSFDFDEHEPTDVHRTKQNADRRRRPWRGGGLRRRR